MAKKSVENQLIDFLRSNPSRWASVALEKMEWKNRNGSPANPRTLIRRLQENTFWESDTPQHKKNLNGVLIATYENNTTYYNIKSGYEKKPVIDMVRHPFTGEMITTKAYALL